MNSSTNQPNPYAPPTAEVSDAEDSDAIAEPAGRGIRFGAAVVDGVIYILMYLPILISMGSVWTTGQVPPTSAIFGVSGLITLLLFAVWVAYTIYLVNRNGQTIGKKLLGIKVVRANGSRASLGRIFWLRNVVNAIPSVIPIVGYVYMLVDHLLIFGEKRQCLHDRIADTVVVRA